VLPGLIGVIQATEAVKLILGKGDPLIGRLVTYDALGMRFREVRLRRDPKCPLCGEQPMIRDLTLHAETSEACARPGGNVDAADHAPASAGRS
jgi:bacteriocin biosynthesis cyclodehydratase domain-containing protein